MSLISKDGTAYDLHGPSNAQDAPWVVLIHGLGLCRHIWCDHLEALSAHYRILNYDLYGHGDSGLAPEKASFSVYADQIANLMEELGIDEAHIVGFSIGGMINRRFAMSYEQKTRSLCILNSPHDRGEEAQKQVEARAKKAHEQGASVTLEEALKRWFTPHYLETGTHVQAVRDWRTNADATSYGEAAWVLANGVRELINPPVRISVPVLVMTCENDTGSTPKMSFDIACEIDNAKTIIVPDLKHLGLLEKPASFTQPILDFLQRTDQEAC